MVGAWRVSGVSDASGVSRIREARESRPSARAPMRHRTNPPIRLREADPDPMRAYCDNASRVNTTSSPKTHATANTSAAYPDADDANPAAVGNVFQLATWMPWLGSAGRVAGTAVDEPASRRNPNGAGCVDVCVPDSHLAKMA